MSYSRSRCGPTSIKKHVFTNQLSKVASRVCRKFRQHSKAQYGTHALQARARGSGSPSQAHRHLQCYPRGILLLRRICTIRLRHAAQVVISLHSSQSYHLCTIRVLAFAYNARPVPSPVHLYKAKTSLLRSCCSPKSSTARPRTCMSADLMTFRKFLWSRSQHVIFQNK